MKWQGNLLPLLLLAGQAGAQPPTPNYSLKTDSAPPTALPDCTLPSDVNQGIFAAVTTGGAGGSPSGTRGFSTFIGFLGNPEQNIDPRALTEIYPIFGSAWTTANGFLPSANAQVYGAGLTIALSDRFAAGLNQGGFADVHLSKKDFNRLAALDPLGRFRDVEMGGSRDGWLNLGGFFQYTLIADEADQFLLTGGLRWEAPCGSHEIFQGHGPAHLAPYFTFGKAYGCYHVLATSGYQFPAGPGSDTTDLFYANVHVDRQCFGWLYPLVEVNTSYHTTGVDIDRSVRRGFFNLSSFEASGNIVVLTVGANAVLTPDKLEIGAAYSVPLATQRDFNFSGLLVKMVLKF